MQQNAPSIVASSLSLTFTTENLRTSSQVITNFQVRDVYFSLSIYYKQFFREKIKTAFRNFQITRFLRYSQNSVLRKI